MNPSGFEIHRGINLSHWLSQAFGEAYRDDYINESDFTYLRSVGYDHVRIPIDEKEMWTEQGALRPESFAYLKHALDWSHQHGLRAIVDLHTVRAHSFDAVNTGTKNTLFTEKSAQDHFMGLWKQISGELKKYPVRDVAYEIMNEPVAEDAEDWNKIVERAVATIRELEKDRVIVIGSNRWQSATTFPLLRVPRGDPNLILSVHFYEPLAFTHHLASWTNYRAYKGAVHYPGATITAEDFDREISKDAPLYQQRADATTVWNKAKIESFLQPAFQKANQTGLQLYCGEFGAFPTTEPKERLAWYRDVVDVLEDHQAAWANWEYKAEFGIKQYNVRKHQASEPDPDLIKALMHRR